MDEKMELPKKQLIVKKKILDMIEHGMRQGDVLPSIPVLARELTVSRMTVFRVLEHLENLDLIYRVNGKGTFVGRREKAYQKPLPYFRHGATESGQRPIVTFLSPFEHYDEFTRDFTRGIEDTLDHNKYELVKTHVWVSRVREDKMLREASLKSAGMIVISSYPPEMQQVLHELVHKNYPIVLLDNWPTDLECNSVSTDNEGAVYQGMTYLYGLGHRKIIFASGSEKNSSTFSRIAAYNHFMLKKALLPQVVIGPSAVQHLFRKKATDYPTAIFAVNDSYAMTLYKALKNRVRIPEDVSLLGFDNDPISTNPIMPFSTLAQSKYQIGCKAVQLLEKIMDPRHDPQTFYRYYFPCELIERNSTKNISKPKMRFKDEQK